MKKHLFPLLIYVLIPLLAVSLPFAVAYEGSTPSVDWYIKAGAEGTRPTLCPEATFIRDYKNVIAIGPDDKTLYLTFDAGYDNGNMEKILDTLQAKDVPAAFFVDGNFVKNEPELVARICSEGHILGNHSLSHADMSTLQDYERYQAQIEGWNDLVVDAGGKVSGYFRFPCGRFSETALKYNDKLGIKSVFWSFAYMDWETDNQPSPDAALQKILSRTHNGEILLLHSVSSTNAEILPELIDSLRAEGYTFCPLSRIQTN